VGIGYLSREELLALGVTGPMLRAAGVAWDLRKSMPYAGYERFEFDVPTRTESDAFARYQVRVEEMRQSLRIIGQCLDRLEPGPVMVEDPKIRWPAQLEVGPDGIGNSAAYVRHIMEESMEALINHFKIVTQGIRVPAGDVYQAVESPRGEMGHYIVSNGGNRPYRVHLRGPSFVNLQAIPKMVQGGLVADVIASVASIDPVMGDADR
jgi:NADH-quinone oxidoreductase subunit D